MPIRRTIKNVVKNYTEAEVKVREATSNDPWGPSGSLMAEIARLTYDMVSFTEVMQIIWKRLNDSGKNWRHVYKTLVLLDYLIKAGSENVVRVCRENIYAVQTLKDFQYVEEGKDYGMNVREKAKQLTLLLKDDERLKNERVKMTRTKDRITPNSHVDLETADAYGGDAWSRAPPSNSDGYNQHNNHHQHHRLNEHPSTAQLTTSVSASEIEAARPSSPGEEELQLQLAIAMSKEEHDEEVKREKSEEMKIAMAIEASKRDHEQNKQVREYQQPTKPQQQSHSQSQVASQRAVPQFDLLQDDNEGYSEILSKELIDPWAVPSRPLSNSLPPKNNTGNMVSGNDPWNPVSFSSDPWEAPLPDSLTSSRQTGAYSLSGLPSYSATTSSNGTWGSSSLMATNSNGNNSNRTAAISDFDIFDTKTTHSATNSSSFLNNDVDNLLNMQMQDKNGSKNAGDFLGTNKDLVDLDNLISIPQNKMVNPFAMSKTTNNPFNAPRESANRVPIRQLAASQPPAGFQSFGGPQGLPAPLVPMNSQTGNNTNPFL